MVVSFGQDATPSRENQSNEVELGNNAPGNSTQSRKLRATRSLRKRLSATGGDDGLGHVAHLLSTQALDTSEHHYDRANLETAQIHFQGTIPRRVADPKQPHGYRLARDGELVSPVTGEPAQHYDFLYSDTQIMDEFGIGVSIYFRTVKSLFVLFTILALFSFVAVVQNARYYDPDESSNVLIKGSAFGADRSSLKLDAQVAYDIIVTITLTIFAVYTGYKGNAIAEDIDLSQQTTQDYSVAITNPPPHIRDPDKYFEYFKQFGDVVFITYLVNNGDLLAAIREKRVYTEYLHILEGRKVIDNEIAEETGEHAAYAAPYWERWFSWMNRLPEISRNIGFVCKEEVIIEQLHKINKKIEDLTLNKAYVPWRVFCVFNQESSQRACLEALNSKEKSSREIDGFKLRGKEAPEPDEIFYDYSHFSKLQRFGSVLLAYSIQAGLLFLAFYIIEFLEQYPIVVSLFVSAVNGVLPTIAIYLTTMIEIHTTEGQRQQSILTKLIISRCVTSTVLVFAAVPFEKRFSSAAISQIQVILLSDTLFYAAYKLYDPLTFLPRIFVAPYLRTQRELNSYYHGKSWNLAERYTDVLKTVFTALFFLVPLPTGLYLTAVNMGLTYLVDKYCVFNLWKIHPAIDHKISEKAHIFFCFSIFMHIIVSQIYFAGWPFESASQEPRCRADIFCDTDDNMTSEQKEAVYLYRTAAYVALAIAGIMPVWRMFIESFELDEDNTTRTTEIAFRDVDGQHPYIPQLYDDVLPCPVVYGLASNIPDKYKPRVDSNNDGHRDTVNESVLALEDFKFLPQDDGGEKIMRENFGKCVYYPPQQQWEAPKPAGTRKVGNLDPMTFSDAVTAGAEKNKGYAAVPQNQSLPVGWEECQTPEGKTYYMDHNTETTHWSLPANTV
jgi:hypothetical protein